MDIDQAIKVLNKVSHDKNNKWKKKHNPIRAISFDNVLSEFEAIAIAEKYERDRAATQPESTKEQS